MHLGSHLWLNIGIIHLLTSSTGLLVLVRLRNRLLHIDVPDYGPLARAGFHPVHWLVHGDDTSVCLVKGIFTAGMYSDTYHAHATKIEFCQCLSCVTWLC